MRYANNEVPAIGDRIKDGAGGLGTVTAVWNAGGNAEPPHFTVRWDEGIVEIDYGLADKFALVSRASAKSSSSAGHS